jgi:ribosome maturation factor RimP
MAASVEIIRTGLNGPLAELGVDLEDVQIQAAGRREIVRVVVDKDGGVDLDLVASVSRLIAEQLDVPPLADQFVGNFVLEVTSPGTDRPLTVAKHWRRAVNRLVEVTLRDGSTVAGRITEADEDSVTLMPASGTPLVMAMGDIVRGMVQVEFTSTNPRDEVEVLDVVGDAGVPRDDDDADEDLDDDSDDDDADTNDKNTD